MRMNLPNQITVARLLIAVVFLVLLGWFDFSQRDRQLWMLDLALVLFIVAAATDWLDGYLARRQNQVTAFGRILDPFVDKILVLGAFVLLLGEGFRLEGGESGTGLSAWMVAVMVARELLVSGLRGHSESQGKAYAANYWGKTKMVLQSVCVGWIIGSVGSLRHVDWVMAGRPWVIWGVVLFTAVSVVAYLFASREALAEQSRA